MSDAFDSVAFARSLKQPGRSIAWVSLIGYGIYIAYDAIHGLSNIASGPISIGDTVDLAENVYKFPTITLFTLQKTLVVAGKIQYGVQGHTHAPFAEDSPSMTKITVPHNAAGQEYIRGVVLNLNDVKIKTWNAGTKLMGIMFAMEVPDGTMTDTVNAYWTNSECDIAQQIGKHESIYQAFEACDRWGQLMMMSHAAPRKDQIVDAPAYLIDQTMRPSYNKSFTYAGGTPNYQSRYLGTRAFDFGSTGLSAPNSWQQPIKYWPSEQDWDKAVEKEGLFFLPFYIGLNQMVVDEIYQDGMYAQTKALYAALGALGASFMFILQWACCCCKLPPDGVAGQLLDPSQQGSAGASA